MRRRSMAGLAVLSLLASTRSGAAQEAAAWPNRPVKLIIPFPPGGSTDFQGRLLCDSLSRQLGQQFVIDHKPGAAGNIGMAELARSVPDGYTMGWITVASHAINPTLYVRLPFDPIKDFSYLSMVGIFPNLLVVNDSVPANTIPELIALLKASPGKYTFASSGFGSTLHLSGEMFKMMTGTDMLHVPYRGGGPALQDLLGGQVHMMFANMPTVLPQARAGKVKALAVTSAERWPATPELPTIAESVPGFLSISWHGVAFPAGVSKGIVEKLVAAIHKALADPELREKFLAGGSQPTPMTPDAFLAFAKEDTARWAPVIRASGAKVE